MAWLGEAGNLSGVTDEQVERAGRGARKMIPPGWYRCALVEDEAKPYHWGTGLSLQFQIISGEFENQRVFDFLCVQHSTSETAEQIARAKLKALAIAAGVKNPDDMEDTAVLYNKPVMIEVYREEQTDPKYGDADGCKAKPGAILSVVKWKEEHGGQPALKAAPTAARPKPVSRPAPESRDEEIPF